MIDVFLCTIGGRDEWLGAITDWWRHHENTRVVVLKPSAMGCVNRDFQRQRRIASERLAAGDFYVCSDDDCMPEPNVDIVRAVEIMKAYPEFGILSFWPSNSYLRDWNPGKFERPKITVGGIVYKDDNVQEHVSVGGIRLMRKGVMEEWPPMDKRADGYDSIQCAYLRSRGYRSGYFRQMHMNHWGRGKSQTWNTISSSPRQASATTAS